MADQAHSNILAQGVETWNSWREPFYYARPHRDHPAPGRPARGRPVRGQPERGHHAQRVEAPVKAKGHRNPATAPRNFVATPLAMRRNWPRACAGRSWSAETAAFPTVAAPTYSD
jgi:hypothetical protein